MADGACIVDLLNMSFPVWKTSSHHWFLQGGDFNLNGFSSQLFGLKYIAVEIFDMVNEFGYFELCFLGHNLTI